MKLSNKIFVGTEADTLMQEVLSFPSWSMKDSYALSLLWENLEIPRKVFVEKEQEIFTKYGDLDAENNKWNFPRDVLPSLEKELQELYDIEFDISYEKIVLSEDSPFVPAPIHFPFYKLIFEVQV